VVETSDMILIPRCLRNPSRHFAVLILPAKYPSVKSFPSFLLVVVFHVKQSGRFSGMFHVEHRRSSQIKGGVKATGATPSPQAHRSDIGGCFTWNISARGKLKVG